MPDATDILNSIKKASVDANNASQPSDFYFGKVISLNPLKILVEQKMTLGSAQLVLTRNVTNFKTKITIDWLTEENVVEGEDSIPVHDHKVSGVKEITIHNGLRIDEEVILIKKKGGQKYLVLDRVVNA